MNRLIGAFEDLIRRTIGPALTLEMVAGIGVWTVHADPGQLENALLNLCLNARDAMPGGGRLGVETANRAIDEQTAAGLGLEPGQYVSICVSDNGSGMPADVVARAFDPFFTTKPIGVGSGLGLSMVYGFAQQSGGHARIHSEPGQGSNVCIYLPRHDGEAAEDERALPAATAPAGEGETILVVDDEEPIRILVSDLLGELGYRVIEAADGAQALAVLRGGPPISLLITDVGLTGGRAPQRRSAGCCAQHRRPPGLAVARTESMESSPATRPTGDPRCDPTPCAAIGKPTRPSSTAGSPCPTASVQR